MLNVNLDFQYITMFARMRVMQSNIYIIIIFVIILTQDKVPGVSEII